MASFFDGMPMPEPSALVGFARNRIERRRETSWTVSSYAGAKHWIGFEEVAEAAYAEADHDAVEVLERRIAQE